MNEIECFLLGGGSEGSPAYWGYESFIYGGGGGGGGYTKTEKVSVNPGDIIDVTVGSLAGNTIVKDITANCGTPWDGKYYTWGVGLDGGSGGGGGSWISSSPQIPGKGGADGSNGNWGSEGCRGGLGQGSTTRAFAEPAGTLYASGGDGNYGVLRPSNRGYNGNPETSGQGIAIIRWGY